MATYSCLRTGWQRKESHDLILASDWSRQIKYLEYRPLIGRDRSRDLNTKDKVSIYGDHYGPVVRPPNEVARVSLCDVTDDR